ncbi:hypothetical protein WG66_003070 [Moniliophthora roreri]|nr:hypothetical protein WG66_003070 [Moniliophthora roreri]
MSSLDLEETVTPFLDRQFVVALPLNTILVTFLAYSIYVVIFSICISIFRHSKKDPDNDRRNKIYVWSTLLLFGFATILTVMSTWHYYDQALFFYDMARLRNYEPFLEHLAHDGANVAQRSIGVIQYGTSTKSSLYCLYLQPYVVHVGVGVTGSIYMTSIKWNWSLYLRENRMALSVHIINAMLSFLIALLTGRICLESGVLSPIAITINLIIVYVSNPSTPIDFSLVVFQVAGIAPMLVIACA